MICTEVCSRWWSENGPSVNYKRARLIIASLSLFSHVRINKFTQDSNRRPVRSWEKNLPQHQYERNKKLYLYHRYDAWSLSWAICRICTRKFRVSPSRTLSQEISHPACAIRKKKKRLADETIFNRSRRLSEFAETSHVHLCNRWICRGIY